MCLVSHFFLVLHLFLELLLMDMCLSLIQLLMAMTRSQAVRCTRFIMTAFFYSLLEIQPFFSDIWQKTKGWSTNEDRRQVPALQQEEEIRKFIDHKCLDSELSEMAQS